MAIRLGGTDQKDIEAAMSALFRAVSLDNLQDIVKRHKVIHTPVFHALMRQEHLRMVNAKSEFLHGFESIYDDLFWILHSSAYSRQTQADRDWKASTSPTPYEPEFFATVRRELGDAFPSSGPAFQCDTDTNELETELREIVGRQTELAPYEPMNGVSWALLCVECYACQHEYLSTRAFAVDTLAAPAIKRLLLEGRINNDACPRCGDIRRFVSRLWVFEPPQLHDPLLSLTCAWRMDRDLYIFQPPPGTQRDENDDRILEVRFDTLLRSIHWPLPMADDSEFRSTQMGVAYSLEGLASHAESDLSEEDLPRAMTFTIEDLHMKTKSGQLPLHAAQTMILETLAEFVKDWPLIRLGMPGAPLDGHRYLIQALLAESIAASRGEKAGVRAMMAATTAYGFLHLSEVGLAEAALARASDQLAKLSPDDPLHEIATLAVTDMRHYFLRQAGRMEEADKALDQLSQYEFGETLACRFVEIALESSKALMSYATEELAAALAAFPNCLKQFRELAEEAEASSDQSDQAFARKIRGALSGDLGNLAAVLTDIAKAIRLYKVLVLPAPEAEKRRRLEGLHVDVRDPARTVDAARHILRRRYGASFNETVLEDDAARLLEEALEIAEEVESWESAGVQAHRLMLLRSQRNDADGAMEVANKAVRFAARAGDLARLSTAHAFMGQQHALRGESVRALDHFEHAAEHWIRNQIRKGIYLEHDVTWIALADEALKTAQAADDPGRGVMVAESLKEATTAASLARETPFAPADDAASESSARLKELSREIELHRLQEIWNPDDQTVRDAIEASKKAYDALKYEIGLRDPRFARWVDATDIGLSDLQSVRRRILALGPRTTIVGFITNGPTLWTYAIWNEGALLELSSAEELDAARSDSVAAITDESLHASAGRVILDPLEPRLSQLQQDDHLVICPGPFYAHLPWAALRFRGQSLCTRFHISVVPGIGSLEACLDRPQPDHCALLALGGPHRPGLADLPHARSEAKSISAVFRDLGHETKYLIGPNATVTALLQRASNFSVVHIACHGEPAASQSERARLFLAPDVAGGDSGVLAEDRIISELRLIPGCTVNLAGCWTARQIARKGPLLGGLVSAFLVAGARSVIGSLFPIDDENALAFQKQFYRAMANGAGVAEGLSRTQRMCIEGGLGEAMTTVEAWAPYVVYGGG